MSKELYVGKLSYDTTEEDLRKLFSVSGTVTSVHLITDPKTGEFKGCGYVRMLTESQVKDAIESLDGAFFMEHRITVSKANPQKQLNKPGGKKPFRPGGSRPGGAPKPAGGPGRKGPSGKGGKR